MPEDKAAKSGGVTDPHASYAPTPTQEENDLAAMGQGVMDKAHDGSPITDHGGDPQSASYKGPIDESRQAKKKESQAEQPARGGYQTRQATPQQTRQPTPSHPPPLAPSSSE